MRERASTMQNVDAELEASVHAHQPALGQSPGCPPWSLLVGASTPTPSSSSPSSSGALTLAHCLILVQDTNHVGQIHAFINQHLLITKWEPWLQVLDGQ